MLPELFDHPHARAVLAPALEPGGAPSHAYLFHGRGGSGKRAAARAFAARLLAEGSPEPAGAHRRALNGSHPDLTWVVPSGAHEMLVSDVDEPVIAAATRTPFESSRRVFVIERADEMGEEAANRMLKTLEEPPPYVHIILISDRPSEVLPTIRSRCLAARFDPPAAEALAAALQADGVPAPTAAACARLSLGDAGLARELAESAAGLREHAEAFARAVCAGEAARARPWSELLKTIRAQGERVGEGLREQMLEEQKLHPAKERRRLETEWNERIRRTRRRDERRMLDISLQLVSLWLEDLLALEVQASDAVRNVDRRPQLAGCAGADAGQLLRATEAVEETRTRFALNVSEELACEALAYRIEQILDT